MAKIMLGVYRLKVAASNDNEPGGTIVFILHPNDSVPSLKFRVALLEELGYQNVQIGSLIWCNVKTATLEVLSPSNSKVVKELAKSVRNRRE